MTDLRAEAYEIPAAQLGLENPLPVFRNAEQDTDVTLDASVPEDDRRYIGWRTAYRVLPYRIQDGYNRDKRPRAFNAQVLENEFLRATFLPELGGRLVSLFHKPAGRELLDRNPVFQPANLALRNAWFSGGIEWNTSHLGHYYLTCAPVFAAKVSGNGYPVLRLYEWDRVKCFPWQIDFHLPPKSEFLFTRVRLCNPHDKEISMYWWTNIAVPEREDCRTLCPVEEAIHGSNKGIALVAMPLIGNTDVSYSTRLPGAQEFFFRISDTQRRWIAHLDGKGQGLVHTSTSRLRGRKMFCWGMNPGGRRWQEFLAEPGQAYLEIQAGLARTQLESLPMPANSQWTWTEAFGLLEADPHKVHSKDWADAWRAADAALEKRLPESEVARRDSEFEAITSRQPDAILSYGSGWGALERRRLSVQNHPDRIPSELPFGETGIEQAPWVALLEKGSLPETSPEKDPGQAMVQDEWRALLEQSLATQKGNWLDWLNLGNMRLEALDRAGARAAWQKSLQHRRNAWALRNLAVVEGSGDANWQFGWHIRAVSERPTPHAVDLMRQAWETGPKIAPLAVEYALMLLQTEQYNALRELVRSLDDATKKNERIRILSAKAALELGEFNEVEQLFDQDFATIREGELTLSEIWFEFHERRIAAAEKIKIDENLRERVRKEFPPPRKIDFRMIAQIG